MALYICEWLSPEVRGERREVRTRRDIRDLLDQNRCTSTFQKKLIAEEGGGVATLVKFCVQS